MSETYARDGQLQAAAGIVILMVTGLVAAVLVIAGLIYATGISGRHKAALAAAACEPNLSPSGLQCTDVGMLTAQYLAIVNPAMQQVNTDAATYTANERHDLGAAEAALTAEVASEHGLGARLAAFPFPPVMVPVANSLEQAIQARATLLAEQARSSSLTQLRSFSQRVKVANLAVQTEMKLLRQAVGTRPTASQEP